MRDLAASPAPILGHIFAGDAVTIEIPWAYVECAIAIGACVAVGAVIGVIRVGWQMWGERR